LSNGRMSPDASGKVVDDATKRLAVLHAPSLRAKLRQPNNSTPARPGDDIVVLFEFNRTFNWLLAPRISENTPTVWSERRLIDWKNKLTSLCFIPIATFQEHCSCDFGGRRLCMKLDSVFATVSPWFRYDTNNPLRSRDAGVSLYRRFAFRKEINWPFSTIDSEQTWRISGFDEERV
jgi:hypothetical protein